MIGRRAMFSMTLATVVAAACCFGATAQQPLAKLSEKITEAPTITAAAKPEVDKFIDAVDKSLASKDPQLVKTGRELAVTMLTRQKVSNSFRTSFAALMLPRLLKVVEAQNGFTSTNAIEVIEALQCPDSIAALADLSSPVSHEHLSTRIVASAALASLRTPIELQQSQADSIIKDIGANLAKETDWMVTAYDLQALQTFSVLPQVPKQSQATARNLLIGSLGSIVTRVRKGEADASLMRAVQRSLAIYLRDQVPKAAPADVAAYVKGLEPTLKEIKLLAEKPPAGATDSTAFAQAANKADLMLRSFGSAKPAGKTQPKPPAK
ncbi:MAG: hypothetical protein ACKO4V_08080 [Planctomycetota bacterium]